MSNPLTPVEALRREADRAFIVRQAVSHWRYHWPPSLSSGVMFYLGERITRAEFEKTAKDVP